jgi:N6-L-threonylcarbamoyladenine synthase
MNSKRINILSIESSCDETAAAVLTVNLKNKWPAIQTLSSVIKSQISLHKSFGGVVPEVAARAHVKNIVPVVEKALSTSRLPGAQTGSTLQEIDYIAVTQGPGLIPSLLVGVEFAKALSLATNKPIIPVNHMLGHLYSPFGGVDSKVSNLKSKQNLKSIFPHIALIVSGGHTMLVVMQDEKNYQVIGETLDDAAGEAFDKVAKMLKLPYPGGPQVSKLAAQGNPEAIKFPRPLLNQNNFNFSFSGLKTSVLYYLHSLGPSPLPLAAMQNICASFEQAAVDVLVTKTLRAAEKYQAKSVSLSGGVSANQKLRQELKAESEKRKIKFFVPPFQLSTDNAEMIGIAAAFMLHRGFKPVPYSKVQADSNLRL